MALLDSQEAIGAVSELLRSRISARLNSLNVLGHLIHADGPLAREFCDTLAEVYFRPPEKYLEPETLLGVLRKRLCS